MKPQEHEEAVTGFQPGHVQVLRRSHAGYWPPSLLVSGSLSSHLTLGLAMPLS